MAYKVTLTIGAETKEVLIDDEGKMHVGEMDIQLENARTFVRAIRDLTSVMGAEGWSTVEVELE